MADNTAFERQTIDRLNRMEGELRYWRLGGILSLSIAAVVSPGNGRTGRQGVASRDAEDRRA